MGATTQSFVSGFNESCAEASWRLVRQSANLPHRSFGNSCEPMCASTKRQRARMRGELAVEKDRHSGINEVNGQAPAPGKIARRSRASASRYTAQPMKSKMSRSKFKADMAGGSLKLPESRIVAGLLIDDVSAEDWRRAIEDENVLQKRSPGTACATQAANSISVSGRIERTVVNGGCFINMVSSSGLYSGRRGIVPAGREAASVSVVEALCWSSRWPASASA